MLNGLTRAVRRGRLEEPTVERFLQDLTLYEIVIDARPMYEQWFSARKLILKHRLSAYDAAYVALVRRQGIGLATLHGQLRLAAEAEGVSLTI